MAESETRELESKIALLQGRSSLLLGSSSHIPPGQIQQHKEQLSTTGPASKTRRTPQHTTYGSPHAYHPYRQHYNTVAPQGYKKKTLNISNSPSITVDHLQALQAPTLTTSVAAAGQHANGDQAPSSWIATASRNAQIINSAAYDPTAARERVLDPANKIKRQVQAIRQELSSSQLKPRLLTVDGIQYSVEAGGSKLVRVGGGHGLSGSRMTVDENLAGDKTLPTPKQVTVSGLTFLRSKNGNLYRSTIVKRNRNALSAKPKTELCRRFTNTGTTPRCPSNHQQIYRLARQDVCTLLTSGIGSCSYGPKCAFIHDPSKVAICREFLRSGSCSQGQHCDLSHDPTYERVPACVHFLRGTCNKDKCPYPHVRINLAAPVCRAFTSLGYCSKGIECQDKHVFECPDYAEGNCHNPKCRLPHVDRAGQLRQQNNTNSALSHSTIHHDHVMSIKSENLAILDSSSDIDSENEVMLDGEDTTFSQEQDFVRF